MGQGHGGREVWASGVTVFGLLLLAGCEKPSASPTPVMATAGGTAATAGATAAAGGQTSAGGAPSDASGFVEAQWRGYCARLFRCFEASDDFMVARLLLKTPEGCEAELRKVEMQSPGRRDLQKQLAAGALHYDAAAAENCVAELSTCNGTDSLTEGSCRDVYEGGAKTGEACQRSEDCAGDGYCQSDRFMCPGQCQPRKKSGETCGSVSECSYSSGVVVCDRDAVPAVCRTLSVGAKAQLGEPCTRRQGSAELVFCADELWCDWDEQLGLESAQGRCAAPLELGAPCHDGDDVCVGGLCDTTAGVCVELQLRSQAGETCDEAEKTVCDPTHGLRCNDQGTCDVSGDGSAGSDCFSGDFQRGCGAGLYCAIDDTRPAGTCRPLLVTGAACQQSNECESGDCNTTCLSRYCAR